MDSLFPSRLDENISSEAPVRLVNQIVDELDISRLLSCLLSPHAFESVVLRLPEQCVLLS